MSFTISLENPHQIDGKSNSEVYWAILAKNRQGQFCHMSPDGTLTPMSESDNTNPVSGPANCQGNDKFANYFSTLEAVPQFTIPDDAFINSGQVWISLGDWLPICVNQPNGMGYAPPSVTNPGLQGYSTNFQMAEFAYNVYGQQQLNADTTSVDDMGFPITMALTDGSGTQTVGFNASRSALIEAFQNCPDKNFSSLVISGDLRILSPEHAAAVPGGYQPPPGLGLPASAITYFSSFYNDYIDHCWTYYASNTVTLYIDGAPYTGQVQNGNLNFWSGTSIGDSGSIVCTISKPLNWEVLQCDGQFKTGNTTQQNIKKFVVAAMYRTVFTEAPTDGSNSWCGSSMVSKYYTNEPINYYAKILHENSLDGLCYAFAFDDVCDQSSSVVSKTTQSLALTLPAWS